MHKFAHTFSPLLLFFTTLVLPLSSLSSPHPTPNPSQSPTKPVPSTPQPPPPPQLPSPPPLPPPPPPSPPPAPDNGTCPAESLKLGACVDMLAGLVHIGIGPQVKAFCCPLIMGLAGIDAATCLCLIIMGRLLDLSILMPLALQLLVYCGNAPPPGYRCPIPP